MSCSGVSEMLLKNQSEDIVGMRDYFSSDLPMSLSAYMTKKFIHPLMTVESFVKDVLVRDEVQIVFT